MNKQFFSNFNHSNPSLLCTDPSFSTFPETLTPLSVLTISMADLHNDVTYEGWGKTSTACYIENVWRIHKLTLPDKQRCNL